MYDILSLFSVLISTLINDNPRVVLGLLAMTGQVSMKYLLDVGRRELTGRS